MFVLFFYGVLPSSNLNIVVSKWTFQTGREKFCAQSIEVQDKISEYCITSICVKLQIVSISIIIKKRSIGVK